MKFLIFLLFPILCFSQVKKYDVSFSYGAYKAPTIAHTWVGLDSNKSVSKDYYSLQFSYRISRKWSLTSGFVAGKFNYYDDTRSNAWDEPTKYQTSSTNARGYDFHSSVILNYNFINYKELLFANLGAGLGLNIQRLKYPYRQPCSSGCEVFIGETSSSEFEFPFNLETYYLLKKGIGLGVRGGGFLTQNLRIIGLHIGPQIKILL